MHFISFFRACRFAALNFWRNIWLSVVTIIILVLTLFSMTLSAGLNLMAKEAITLVKERVDVSIYFAPEALEEDVRKVADALAALPEVKDVTYISREEALASFRTRTADNPILKETLDTLDENPLGATLVVKAKDIADFPAIIAVVDKPEYAELIQDRDFEENQQVIDRLTQITDRITQIGYAVSAIFALIAMLVIFNTIRITIYTYREEIGIMKLVGASNWFVRAPFVLESVFYAALASALSMLIVLLIAAASAPYVNGFFSGYDFQLGAFLARQLWPLFLLQLLVGVLLSVLSSVIAISRYLRR